MRRFIAYCIILVISGLAAFAMTDLANKADSLYMRNEFHSAISSYEEAIEKYGASSDMYYNLANAYYKSDKLGKAILNYERALKMDAGNDDAKYNLSFVSTKIIDNLPDNRNFITRVVDSIVYSISSNAWAYISLIILILLLVAIAGYMYIDKIIIRKIGFFGAIVLIAVLIGTISCSIISAVHSNNNNEAIILDESVMLSTSPREPLSHAEEAVLLHEGTKVEIVDSLQTPNDSTCRLWYEVVVNNNRAWIKSKSVEKI